VRLNDSELNMHSDDDDDGQDGEEPGVENGQTA